MSYLHLPNRASNLAFAPNAAPLQITGDLTIVAKASLNGFANFLGRWSNSYLFAFDTDGKLRLYWRQGGVLKNQSSTVSLGWTPGLVQWFAATLDVDNGAGGHDVKFWTSGDGVTWAQNGTTVTTAGTTSVDAGSDALLVGEYGVSNKPLNFYRAQVYSGSGFSAAGPTGTLVFDANFEKQAPGTTSFTEDSANAATVTVGSSSQEPRAAIVGRRQAGGLFLPGRSTTNFASIPGNQIPIATYTELDARLLFGMDKPASTNSTYLFGQTVAAAAQTSWYTYIAADGSWRLYVSNGTTLSNVTLLSATPSLMVGAPRWLRWTWRSSDGQARLLMSPKHDGVNWTVIGSSTVGVGYTLSTYLSSNLMIGAYLSGELPFQGNILRATVASTIDGSPALDINFTKQPRGTTSFTEDANGATVTVNSSVSEPRAMILGRVG